jgi:hypothetical protein
MAEFRTAADFGIVKRPPYSWRSQFGVPGLFSPSKEEAEAIRKKEEKDRLIAQAQLRQQKAAGLVGNALAQEQQGPLDRTAQLNLAPPNEFDQAVIERSQGMAPVSTLPQQQLSAVSTPTAVDLTATQLAPETEAIQAARMGDTSLSQQALGMVSPVSNSDRLNQFSDEYLAKVGKRKKLLSGIAGLFGVTSRADEYERNALIKYTDYIDNQAALIALEGDMPETKAQLASKFFKAGGSIDAFPDFVASIWPDDPAAAKVDQKQYNFTSPDGKTERPGFIVEEEGKNPTRWFYGPEGVEAVPHDWTQKSGGSSTMSVTMPGVKSGEGTRQAMIKEAKRLMEKARGFWLDDQGKLREDRKWVDSLGWKGAARTTKLNMRVALSMALRLESGAAIGDDERAQFYELFMPNLRDWASGDRAAVIEQKFENFLHYVGLINELVSPKGEGTDADRKAIYNSVLDLAAAEIAEAALPKESDKVNPYDVIEGDVIEDVESLDSNDSTSMQVLPGETIEQATERIYGSGA